MKAESILQADVLDIIFEHKNKEFGAYPLRKYYNKRLMSALAIMALTMAFVSLLIWKNRPVGDPIKKVGDIFLVKAINIPAPPIASNSPTQRERRQVNKNTMTKRPQVSQGDGPPVISSQPAPLVNFNAQQGLAPAPGDSGDSQIVAPESTELYAGKGKSNEGTVHETVDVLPSYPGGLAALRTFLENNLSTPGEINAGESVTVKVRFIVGYDGKLKSFDFVEAGDEAFNNEVSRVLKKMPDWIPGKSNGKNVSTYYVMPVKFVAAD